MVTHAELEQEKEKLLSEIETLKLRREKARLQAEAEFYEHESELSAGNSRSITLIAMIAGALAALVSFLLALAL